jgi:hypothetical protein
LNTIHYVVRTLPIIFFVFLSAIFSRLQAQPFYLGVNVGGVNYQGELQGLSFSFTGMHISTGVGGMYEIDNNLSVMAEFSKGYLSGRDAQLSGNSNNVARNLSFDTDLWEVSMVGRFRFYKGEKVPVVPYVFGGGAVFHVDPWARDAVGQRQKLYPLSTEGQGIPGYGNVPLHRNTRFSVPFGGGIECMLGKHFRLDVEAMFRKSFTDHLDDVSTQYPDAQLLLRERGAKAVELSYRGDDVPGGSQTFPAKGTQRGNPLRDDWYHSLNVRLRMGLYDFRKETIRRKGEKKFECWKP